MYKILVSYCQFIVYFFLAIVKLKDLNLLLYLQTTPPQIFTKFVLLIHKVAKNWKLTILT